MKQVADAAYIRVKVDIEYTTRRILFTCDAWCRIPIENQCTSNRINGEEVDVQIDLSAIW